MGMRQVIWRERSQWIPMKHNYGEKVIKQLLTLPHKLELVSLPLGNDSVAIG